MITIRGKEALNLFAQNVHDRDKKCQQSIYKKEYSLRNIILSVLLPYSDAVIALSYELKKICIRNGVEPKKLKSFIMVLIRMFFTIWKKICVVVN